MYTKKFAKVATFLYWFTYQGTPRSKSGESKAGEELDTTNSELGAQFSGIENIDVNANPTLHSTPLGATASKTKPTEPDSSFIQRWSREYVRGCGLSKGIYRKYLFLIDTKK